MRTTTRSSSSRPALSAPWVGILRYHELMYTCADKSTASCAPSKKLRVTEIFRFQGGKWVY